jgi:hypothetical protein
MTEPTMREQFDSWLKTMPSINSLETQLCWITWQTCCKVHPHGSQEQEDAAIGRLVREKLTSGNSIPVERCSITAAEVVALRNK